jgi:hypothetical protein
VWGEVFKLAMPNFTCVPVSSDLVVIAIKPEDKENVSIVAMLLFWSL